MSSAIEPSHNQLGQVVSANNLIGIISQQDDKDLHSLGIIQIPPANVCGNSIRPKETLANDQNLLVQYSQHRRKDSMQIELQKQDNELTENLMKYVQSLKIQQIQLRKYKREVIQLEKSLKEKDQIIKGLNEELANQRKEKNDLVIKWQQEIQKSKKLEQQVIQDNQLHTVVKQIQRRPSHVSSNCSLENTLKQCACRKQKSYSEKQMKILVDKNNSYKDQIDQHREELVKKQIQIGDLKQLLLKGQLRSIQRLKQDKQEKRKTRSEKWEVCCQIKLGIQEALQLDKTQDKVQVSLGSVAPFEKQQGFVDENHKN